MDIIYRAKDGKEFDDEFECEEYENDLEFKKLPFEDIITLTYYNEKVDENDIYNFWNSLRHIFFKTKESIEQFEQIFNNFETDFGRTFDEFFYDGLPEPKQWYHYDSEREFFISDEQEIKKFQDRMEEYDDILKKINQEESEK